MKLVKEHINEKFEEESDPVEDMGIGIVKLIEDYKKKFAKINNWHLSNVRDKNVVEDIVLKMANYDSEKRVTDDQFQLYMRMISYMLKHGVDINTPNMYLLSHAMSVKDKTRKKELLKFLMDNGLKITSYEDIIRDGTYENGDNELTRYIFDAELKKRKTETNIQKFKNRTLILASNVNNPEMIKWALDKGANAGAENYIALQSALQHKQKDLVKALIKILQNDPEYK